MTTKELLHLLRTIVEIGNSNLPVLVNDKEIKGFILEKYKDINKHLRLII